MYVLLNVLQTFSSGSFLRTLKRYSRKHSHIKEDALSWLEIRELLIANRGILDPISWYVVLIAHIYTQDRSLPTNEETC
jgi:hypothetical protein